MGQMLYPSKLVIMVKKWEKKTFIDNNTLKQILAAQDRPCCNDIERLVPNERKYQKVSCCSPTSCYSVQFQPVDKNPTTPPSEIESIPRGSVPHFTLQGILPAQGLRCHSIQIERWGQMKTLELLLRSGGGWARIWIESLLQQPRAASSSSRRGENPNPPPEIKPRRSVAQARRAPTHR
jgi:hypothetical protein